jgi:hypothetical protein
MIPISSAIFSGHPNQLDWTKAGGSHRYELSFNGETVGRLERPSFWSSRYSAETSDGRWTFRPAGCFGGAEIIDEASGGIIASMKSNWGSGGGTLVFADGQRFAMMLSGWWRQVWSVAAENGQPVLRLHAREKTMELTAGAEAVRGRLSLLAMFTYYRVLKVEEDAAAAVLVAGVS